MSGEPAHFNARAMARWLASRGRPRTKRQPAGPRPTLAQLQRSHCWTWVYCEKCLHHAPMALVPLIIRWGVETSSDRLRQCARCTKCGHKGATLQHPGWGGADLGFLPFPVEKLVSPPIWEVGISDSGTIAAPSRCESRTSFLDSPVGEMNNHASLVWTNAACVVVAWLSI
jgi:hypothetical protein